MGRLPERWPGHTSCGRTSMCARAIVFAEFMTVSLGKTSTSYRVEGVEVKTWMRTIILFSLGLHHRPSPAPTCSLPRPPWWMCLDPPRPPNHTPPLLRRQTSCPCTTLTPNSNPSTVWVYAVCGSDVSPTRCHMELGNGTVGSWPENDLHAVQAAAQEWALDFRE